MLERNDFELGIRVSEGIRVSFFDFHILETLSGICLRGVLFLNCIPKCKYGQLRTC